MTMKDLERQKEVTLWCVKRIEVGYMPNRMNSLMVLSGELENKKKKSELEKITFHR